jgi:hypothetical protein
MDNWRRRDKWDWYGATVMVWVLIAAIVIGWFTYANSF